MILLLYLLILNQRVIQLSHYNHSTLSISKKDSYSLFSWRLARSLASLAPLPICSIPLLEKSHKQKPPLWAEIFVYVVVPRGICRGHPPPEKRRIPLSGASAPLWRGGRLLIRFGFRLNS
jgi:hypothetical protein